MRYKGYYGTVYHSSESKGYMCYIRDSLELFDNNKFNTKCIFADTRAELDQRFIDEIDNIREKHHGY